MDERMITAGLIALAAMCVIVPMRVARLRRRLERLSAPPAEPKGDPKHLPYIVAPAFLAACVVFALGGALQFCVLVFVAALALSLKVYRHIRERRA